MKRDEKHPKENHSQSHRNHPDRPGRSGGSSIALNYRNTVSAVNQMMSETAVLAAERIEQELVAYKSVAIDTARITQLSNSFTSLDDKRAIIDERVRLHGFQRGNFIGPDGISIFDGKDYSDREYSRRT